MQVNQQFDVDVVPATLLKTRLHHRHFAGDFDKFFSLQLYKKRDSDTGVFLLQLLLIYDYCYNQSKNI